MSDESSLTGPVRRVGIVAKARLTDASLLLRELAAWLHERGVEPVFESDTAAIADDQTRRAVPRDDLPAHSDLIIVLGGDGTLLAMADRIALAGLSVPILGVNFGSLGFLTEITLPELYPALEAALAGTAQLETRLMLQCRVERDASPLLQMPALNDVVITRGVVSRIIDFSVTVDDQFVARFKADGLILATPTGSTAYNLAAGGPIVHPAVDAVVLTPIAPHTLTNRPVVIPAASRIRLQPLPSDVSQEMFVTFDGQTGRALGPDDSVIVERAPRPLCLVRAGMRSYFEVLRQKLKWAER